jgi:thiol-disulfide isomerase/thioredoxin
MAAAELRGRVVLVNFWTYTCINWLRTLPYLRAWAERYQDHGLVVIGVHTPEFEGPCTQSTSRAPAAGRCAGPPVAYAAPGR